MTTLFIAATTASFLFLLACGETVAKRDSGIVQVNAKESDNANAVALPNGTELSNPEIIAMSYRAATHDLSIELKYSGCGVATHELILGACQESFPQRCDAQLVRRKNYDTRCPAFVTETLIAPLSASLDVAYVVLKSSDGTNKSTLVDKTGKGGPIPPGDSSGLSTESDATIRLLTYDKATHSLKLELSYNGCGFVQHTLQFGNACEASFPSGCSAKLMRITAPDNDCATEQNESMVYKLNEDQDTMVLTVANNRGQGARVLIDHYDKVSGLTNPLSASLRLR